VKQVGITADGIPVFDGVFFIGTEGIPLDVVIGELRARGMTICWPTYSHDAIADGAKFRELYTKLDKIACTSCERYVTEFAGRHNVRGCDTIVQMTLLAKGLDGKRLRYDDLVAAR